LIVVLEIVPLIVGVAFLLTYGNLNVGFQAYLTCGTFVSLAVILLWWVGSTLESYKRVFMFFFPKKTVFARLKIKDIDDSELHAEKISEVDRVIEEATQEQLEAEFEQTPLFGNKLNPSEPPSPSITRQRSDSYISQNYGTTVSFDDELNKDEYVDVNEEYGTKVESPDSRTSSVATGDDEDFFQIRTDSGNRIK